MCEKYCVVTLHFSSSHFLGIQHRKQLVTLSNLFLSLCTLNSYCLILIPGYANNSRQQRVCVSMWYVRYRLHVMCVIMCE